MKRVAAIMFAIVAGLGAAAAGEEGPPPQGPAPTPAVTRDITLLLRLQDATAAGDGQAMGLQKELLARIALVLGSQAPGEPRRLVAPVTAFVLSGGDPAAADRLAKAEGLDGSDMRLLAGAAAFMRGERGKATEGFATLEALGLPATIAGRVALAQAMLETRDAGARQSRLSEAAAAMPGTLVEESALRRSALAYAESRDETPFWRRIARYQRRFPHSLYAPAFWQAIIAALITWESKGRAPDLGQFDVVMSRIPVAERRRFYLHLARGAVSAGAERLVVHGATRLRRLALPGSAEDTAARLYSGAYRIVTGDAASALADLESLRRDLLPLPEQALLQGALAMGRGITGYSTSILPAGLSGQVQKGALEVRAETLLDASARLLAEAGS